MLPRLQAERAIELHQALIAAGGLMMEERPRAQYLDSMQRQVTGGKRRRRPSSSQLQAMGIGVRKEPAAQDPPKQAKGGDDGRRAPR
jgi:lipopolysaccharide biosynthesis regulator YciM